MPLKAYPPGTRKGNQFYIIRGRIDGQRYEIRTRIPGGTPRRTILAALADAEREIRIDREAGRIPSPGEGATFRRVADLYIAAKNLGTAEIKRLDRLCAARSSDPSDKRAFGEFGVDKILHPVVVDIARTMIPHGKPSTWNREVMVPVSSVMHYAADQAKLCPYIKLAKFSEDPPETRAVDIDTAALVINAAPDGPKRRLLLWIFHQGNRISEPLRITWNDIDLTQRTVRTIITKPRRRVRVKALAEEVFEALAAIPEADRTGYLFPWRTRTGVYNWLRPMCQAIGVKFTPHMARHTLATQINATGGSLKTIMEALDHRSERSSLRYTAAGVEVVRAAIDKAYRRPNRETDRAGLELLCALLAPLIGRQVSLSDLDLVKATLTQTVGRAAG